MVSLYSADESYKASENRIADLIGHVSAKLPGGLGTRQYGKGSTIHWEQAHILRVSQIIAEASNPKF